MEAEVGQAEVTNTGKLIPLDRLAFWISLRPSWTAQLINDKEMTSSLGDIFLEGGTGD